MRKVSRFLWWRTNYTEKVLHCSATKRKGRQIWSSLSNRSLQTGEQVTAETRRGKDRTTLMTEGWVHSNHAESHLRRESSKYTQLIQLNCGCSFFRLSHADLPVPSSYFSFDFRFVVSPRTRATYIIPLRNAYYFAFVMELRMKILNLPIQRPIFVKTSSETTPIITTNCQKWQRHESSLLNISITNTWPIYMFTIIVLY
jgi:hypothetical protein